MVHTANHLDHYSIIDQPVSSKEEAASLPSVRFPGDDGGKSLTDMAQRDLESALQLLAERAQYITGASGAAIALLEDGEMICRASAGTSAPELGAEVQIKAGLTGESVRTRQVLRCDDAETDPRVNRESCRSLGVRSVMVMPLVREQEVVGVFELMADRARAFEERDVTALERLAEMVLTSLEHADAAKRALQEIATKTDQPKIEQKAAEVEEALATNPATVEKTEETLHVSAAQGSSPAGNSGDATSDSASSTSKEQSDNRALSVHVPEAEPTKTPQEQSNIRTCQACGFPVSAGRKLCVDCETARHTEGGSLTSSHESPEFLSHFGSSARKQSWLGTHIYTIGTVLIAVLTIALLMFRLK